MPCLSKKLLSAFQQSLGKEPSACLVRAVGTLQQTLNIRACLTIRPINWFNTHQSSGNMLTFEENEINESHVRQSRDKI